MVISRIKALFLEHLSCQWILLCFIMYEWHRLELNSSYESTNIMKKKNVIYKYKEIVLLFKKKHLQSIGFRYCAHVSTKTIWPTHKVLKITKLSVLLYKSIIVSKCVEKKNAFLKCVIKRKRCSVKSVIMPFKKVL